MSFGGYFIVFATFYKVLITQDSYNLRKLITQIKKRGPKAIAVPQFFTRGSSNELPLVLWVFYRV
ncbi:hypothetical protein, partial [Acinetobacter variabilis]|uniref:hypothetical protein n=2 Tax=Acinetobacter TaxID=469 RepID=UPI001C08FF3D